MFSSTAPLAFTVIISTLDAGATIARCLASLDGQRGAPPFEVLIQDGKSKDATLELCHRSGVVTRVVSEPDHGIYDAWNKALAHARGDWILFLGADDQLAAPDVLARAAAALASVPGDTLVAYGRVALMNSAGEVLDLVGDPWAQARTRMRGVMSLPHQGVFHRRTLFERYGSFDSSYRIAGDYALLARALSDTAPAYVGDLVVAHMAYGGVSTTPANSLRLLREYRRAQRERGQRWPGRAWWASAARVRARLVLWSVLGEERARTLLDGGRWAMGRAPVWTRTS